MPRESGRTKRRPATFYWRFCVSGRHLEEAAEFVVSRLMPVWPSGVARADAIGVIRATLRQAERGRLRPREDCKPIWTDPHLYEIRWTDQITLNERHPVTGLWHERHGVHVRLYFAEEPDGAWFLGLHGHEKVIGSSDEETRNLQDAEIRIAVACWVENRDGRWGVPELERAMPVAPHDRRA